MAWGLPTTETKSKIVHIKRGRRRKGRSNKTYQKKVDKIKKWYNNLIKYREENPKIINKNTKQFTKRKELKPLNYYLDKIKKPQGE